MNPDGPCYPTSLMPKKITPTRRRALQLLADSPGGCTESIVLAHGITAQLIEELVTAGLATSLATLRTNPR